MNCFKRKESFETTKCKKDVWAKIRIALKEKGYILNADADDCDNKWRNLKVTGKQSWDYFDLMDDMLSVEHSFKPVNLLYTRMRKWGANFQTAILKFLTTSVFKLLPGNPIISGLFKMASVKSTSSTTSDDRGLLNILNQKVPGSVENRLIFPIVGYTKSVENVPNISLENILAFYQKKSKAKRQFERSYKFATENYISSGSVETSFNSVTKVVYVKAKCYRSQRKRLEAYTPMVAIKTQPVSITDGACECKAGKLGTCNHIVALLRVLSLLKENGYNFAPPALACTELPQQWNRPRGKNVKPLKLHDINWGAPKENGSTPNVTSRLYEARRFGERTESELNEAVMKLQADLCASGNSLFASSLEQNYTTMQWETTQFGRAPNSSTLNLQVPLIEYGFVFKFSVDVKPKTFYKSNVHFIIPSQYNSLDWDLSSCFFPLPEDENKIILANEVNGLQAVTIEKDTRSQSACPQWIQHRRNRLSASRFGPVIKRVQAWTDKGVAGIVVSKDLTKVPSVRYGLANEPIAVEKYVMCMRNIGHEVVVETCGFIINPQFPHLGASPDRIVYDPAETPNVGLVEVKCAYSFRGHTVEEALSDKDFYVEEVNGKPRLKKKHAYYCQVLGQMAAANLQWCDIVVYIPNGIIVERIRFNELDWYQMKMKLDKFYFEEMLRFIVKK